MYSIVHITSAFFHECVLSSLALCVKACSCLPYRLSLCNPGLWGLDDLDDPDTAAVLQEAIEHPERFVLKPQREGGGNNLYGEAARQKLESKKGLSAYILMQRIRPPINRC